MDPRLLKLNFKTLITSLADIAMPRECVVCQCGLMPCEDDICMTCLADLPLTRFSAMARNPMSDKLNGRLESAEGEYTRPYSYAAALFYYRSGSPYARITQALKYDRNFSAGKHFSRMLGRELASSPLYSDVDAVAPVPLHWRRMWKRGYNQSAVIAREVAVALNAEYCPQLLRRTRATVSQTLLEGESKTANVAGAFAVGKIPAFTPKHLLIVDDVFTSGSTLSSCHRVLSASFDGIRVSCATLGFVEMD